MQRIFSRYFICEEGHVTSSDDKISKCPAKLIEMQYVKGKRKKEWKTITEDKGVCGKKIVEEHDIPEVLDFKTVWSPDVMQAFLQGQKIDSSFMIGLQEQFSKIWEKIDGKN
jgi:hypothetical protein